MAKALYYVLVLLALSLSDAYKILVVFPLPAKSHSILGEGLVKRLLDGGHEVTYITPFVKNNTNPKLAQIDVNENIKWFPTDTINLKAFLNNEVSFLNPTTMVNLFSSLADMTYKNENIQKLINDPDQHFDLVIVEWMLEESYCGFSVVFNCPFAWLSSVDPHTLVLRLIDEDTNPAYVPGMRSSSTTPFSFVQRLQELAMQTFMLAVKYFYMDVVSEALYKENVGPVMAKRGRPLPPYNEVKFNGSLMFGNSHPSLGQATRIPINYIPIGGYHIDDEVKPLTGELKKIVENSKDGFIYFSMGSNLKSKDLPDELKQSLLKMFGTLKYTVLWKFEEQLPNLPKNVHILGWAPQQSLLAQPNCLLFITHGGLLSTTETVHFGVPIIGIPVFGDQFNNMNRAVARGYGKKVDLSLAMAGELKEAIDDILINPKYREKVKELSFIYHHRPVPPGKELVHWAEHVIETRGAPHMRSPALHTPWYQKLYLDLAALVLAVLYCFKILLTYLFCSKKKFDAVKKNK